MERRAACDRVVLTPVDAAALAFDPDALMRALVGHGVDFVVIGGIAALLHGDIAGTGDLDAAVAEDGDNLSRLVVALEALHARLLVDAGGGQLATIDQPVDLAWFGRLASVRLLTDHGILDVVMAADGVGRFSDWARNATSAQLDGYVVSVATLADVIRSKEAAGRPKDHAALPRLRILLEHTQP